MNFTWIYVDSILKLILYIPNTRFASKIPRLHVMEYCSVSYYVSLWLWTFAFQYRAATQPAGVIRVEESFN